MATTIEEYQNLLGQKRKDIGQRIAAIPQTEQQLRGTMFSDSTLQGLRGQEQAKIKELWEHDKRLAEQYANPESEVYLEDPYAREQARATQFQGTVGELGDIQQDIGTRRDVIGDALENAMKLLQYGVEAQKFEYSALTDELNSAIKLEEQRQKKAASGADSGYLTDLFNMLTGLKQKKQEFTAEPPRQYQTPSDRGSKQYSHMLKRIHETFPGKQVELQQNPDKTWNYWVRQEGDKYATPEEAPAYENFDETVRQLLAGSIAGAPKQSGDISAIFKALFPEPQELKDVDKKAGERQDLISSLPNAGTPGYDYDALFIEARRQAKYLTDGEIKAIIEAKGW